MTYNMTITPMSASGMLNIITNGWRKDSNCEAITMYTKKIAKPSANVKLSSEVSISLFCPPITIDTSGGTSMVSNPC